ncbi:hypothetical protein DV738_g2952, partial [Chaetothyriales sp. CBS 135597]
MHFSTLLTLSVSVIGLIAPVASHPGEVHTAARVKRDVAARNHRATAGKRSLDRCAGSIKARELEARNIARRAKTTRDLRAKRGITTKARKYRRDLATLEIYEAVNHNQTGVLNYTSSTAESTVFSANTSCILTPEVTDGPYYVWGELIRQDVKEDLYSDGVDLYLEVQYLDVTTCEPVPDVYVDIWNANATGVYSGISVEGNYAADGYNSTYLRGIQPTDSDGVATFETIFPGHYEGRATHTHLLAHTNVTINEANQTLAVDTGSVVHIGQLFWNEVLRSAVEAVSPYSDNTQAVTTNAEDMWSIVQAEDYDPFPQFLYLGDDITDGLFAWIQIGLNTSADYTDDDYYNIAAYLESDGGPSGGSNSTDSASAGSSSTSSSSSSSTSTDSVATGTSSTSSSSSTSTASAATGTSSTSYTSYTSTANRRFMFPAGKQVHEPARRPSIPESGQGPPRKPSITNPGGLAVLNPAASSSPSNIASKNIFLTGKEVHERAKSARRPRSARGSGGLFSGLVASRDSDETNARRESWKDVAGSTGTGLFAGFFSPGGGGAKK